MSTSRKTNGTRKPAQKASAAPSAKTPDASGEVGPVSPSTSPLKKRDLIEAVVKRSGIKKKDAKPVVEAMLTELGETLAAGRELALPPLGRVKINREKKIDGGRVIILKLRQKSLPAPLLTARTAAE